MFILKAYHISITYIEAIRIFFIGLFLGNVTPGRLGDFGRLIYLKPEAENYKIGLSSIIMDRLFDVICLLFFSVIAVFYYQSKFDLINFSGSSVNYGVWSMMIIVFIGILWIFKNKIRQVLYPWITAFKSHRLTSVKYVLGFITTFISMFLIYGVFNYIAFVMNIPIDPIGLFLGTFVIGVLTLLPISILGLGVREASIVLIFDLFNLSSNDAVALSLIVFFLQIISFLPGVIWFYLSPVSINDLKNLRKKTT